MSEGNWFSQAGSLDDSLDNSNAGKSTLNNTVPTASKPVDSQNTTSSNASFIKPVKGLKDSPVTTDRREPESVNTTPSPAMTVSPATEVNRCRKCGAVIPRGAELCWNCSNAGNIPVANNQKFDARSFLAKNKKLIITSAAVIVTVVVLLIILISAFSHKLSGKYKYVDDYGNDLTFTFSRDGTYSFESKSTANITQTIRGKYYWDSQEKTYCIEIREASFWGVETSTTYNAKKKFNSLVLSVPGYVGTVEFKKV